jgi:CheY-like chemotaxis protein
MLNNAPVLVAEDDPNDVFLLRRAFQKAGVANPIVVFHNGQEAINYLNSETSPNDAQRENRPALFFLDLKMPLMDGFDVLVWLRSRPAAKKMPVIVLTSSNQEKDIEQARQLGADDYRVKPQQFEELIQIVQEVRDRWLKLHSNPNSRIGT